MTNQATVSAVSARPTNPWAIAAFVLSLFGWVGIVTSIISGILAVAALRDIARRDEGGRALAQFALALATLLTVVVSLHAAHVHLTTIANW
jgi:uncharacterized Tic20 family protein